MATEKEIREAWVKTKASWVNRALVFHVGVTRESTHSEVLEFRTEHISRAPLTDAAGFPRHPAAVFVPYDRVTCQGVVLEVTKRG